MPSNLACKEHPVRHANAGDTYPKEATVHGEEPLQSEAESVVARAKVEGVEGEMKHAHRKLQGTEEPAMLSFSLVGL